MKKIVIALALFVGLLYWLWRSDGTFGSQPYSFSVPTMTSSSVGIYSSSLVLSADSGRTFASFCNNNHASGDAVYLGLGATSTKPYGRLIKSQECYQLHPEQMFTGPVYAIASTATTTLLIISK
jgi:hypothetical protein